MAYDEYQDDGGLGLTQVQPQASTPTLSLAPVEGQGGGGLSFSPQLNEFEGGTSPPPAAPASGLQGLMDQMRAKSAKTQSMKDEYLATLSPAEKIGLAFQEFGAGAQGKDSPLTKRLAERVAEKRAATAETHQAIDTMTKGAALVRAQPAGEQRDAFIKLYAETLPANLQEAFKHMTSGPDSDLLHGLVSDPRVVALVKKAALTDPGFAQKVLENPKLLDPFVAKLDAQDLPAIHAKLDALSKSPAFAKFSQGGKVASWVDVAKANAENPDPRTQLSVNEMATLNRHQKDVLPAYGIMTKEVYEKVLEKKATGDDKQPQHIVVDGKQYAYDKGGTEGTRLATDKNYKLLGSAKDPNAPDQNAKIVRDTELKLADDYARDTKGFRDAKAKFSAATSYMNNVAKDPKNSSPASDRALTFAYAKMLDPGDKVAVKDVQDIEKLGNVPTRIAQAVKNLAEGKQLPDAVRGDMFRVIRREFTSLNRQQQETETDYADRAGRYKVDPRNVVLRHAIDLPTQNEGGAGKVRKGAEKKEWTVEPVPNG